MNDPLASGDSRISFLSVGTKILLKDTMDQYLRSVGDFRTYYAPSMASATRTFGENLIHVIITEVEYSDGNALKLMKELGGGASTGTLEDELYVIVALEERTPQLLAFATELEANSILVKPFAAADLQREIQRYMAWKAMPKEPWEMLVREGNFAAREKKFREAETHFLEALKSGPGNANCYYRVGLYYLKKPDLGMAEKLFKKAIELNPQYVLAYSALADLYMSKQKLELAEEFLRKAQELSPLNSERMVGMVKLQIDKCISMCENALRLDAGASDARLLLGKLLAVEKDYAGCIREIEKIMPELRDTVRNEAQTFMALSRKLGGIAK